MKFHISLIFSLVLYSLIVYGQQCSEGETRACQGLDQGECSPGIQICENGQWSICYGAAGPTNEICDDGKDNDCDGYTDEDCECNSGEIIQCGPSTDVGICEYGTRTCVNNLWGNCEGAVLPYPADLCGQSGLGNGLDDDCDGQTDEGCGQQANQSATASCFNGIKDVNEGGIDCGGPCVKCASCFDRIQNQNETGVDCGGPCVACPSCSDGIQNQNEIGIDCGGPCESCEPVIPEKDSDGDGVIDSLDEMPYCPNNICDKSRGENKRNCPEDCKSGNKGITLLIIFIILIFILFMYFVHKFKRETKKFQEKEEKKIIKPMVNIERLRELEKKSEKKKGMKLEAEEQLEKSIKKVEKYIK